MKFLSTTAHGAGLIIALAFWSLWIWLLPFMLVMLFVPSLPDWVIPWGFALGCFASVSYAVGSVERQDD